MAITLQWHCYAHGDFEAPARRGGKTPKCPKGCSPRFVEQEIRSAPSIGGVAKHVDRELNNLASDYKLTDIRNGADGESVMTTLRKNPSFSPTWGQVEHAKPGFSQRGEAAPKFATGYSGVSIDSVKPAFAPIEQKTVYAGRYKAALPT